MNRYQKLAWWNLIVIAATIVVTSTAIAIELYIRGYSTIGPCFFLILALMRLNPLLFKKPHGGDTVLCDERDSLIVKKAVAVAYQVFWIVLIVLSFSLFLIIGPKNSIPSISLPLVVVGGGLFMKIVCSVSILVQYSQQTKGEQS